MTPSEYIMPLRARPVKLNLTLAPCRITILDMRKPCKTFAGNRHWLDSQNKLVRRRGPAVEHRDGYKAWHDRDGELHRDGAPAIEYDDGAGNWYEHGVFIGSGITYSTAHPMDSRSFEWREYAKHIKGVNGMTARYLDKESP